jgi:glycosyltransferase involved in cell wall biosynthesis
MNIVPGIEPAVSLIIPTYSRLDALQNLLATIKAKTVQAYAIIILVDNNNRDIYDWAVANHYRAFLSAQHCWYVAQTNLGVAVCKTEFFVYLNDDMEIVQNGWLRDAMTLFQNTFLNGLGLVKFDDGLQPKNGVACCGLTSKSCAKAIYGGSLLWPGYTHFAADTELTAIMRDLMVGCYVSSDIPIAHNRDTTEKIHSISHRLWWDKDIALLTKRKAAGFPR